MKHLILLLALLASGCSQQNDISQDVAYEVDLTPIAEPGKGGENSPKQPPANQAVISRKLVREGELAFETSDPEKTRKQITAAAAASRAYISTDQQTKSYDRINYVMVVRIPAASFDSFISSATKGVSYFDKKEIKVSDITAEYVDSESRIKTKKEIENRYKQLLAKASSVNDILTIEKELGAIRTEIEATEGQLKLFKDQVQYATLRFEFYTISSVSSSFFQQIGVSFAQGWDNLRAFALILVSVWPFLLLAPLFWFVIRKLRFKKRKEKVPESV